MLPGAAGTAAGGLPYGFTADFSQATSYGLGLGGAGGLDELGGGAAGVAGAGGVGVGVDGALPGFSSQADGFLLSQGFNETQFLDAATGEYYGAFGGAATQVGGWVLLRTWPLLSAVVRMGLLVSTCAWQPARVSGYTRPSVQSPVPDGSDGLLCPRACR